MIGLVQSTGQLRICGDFNEILNPALNVDKYPLPRVEIIFANFSGGKKLTKIDLMEAYLLMEVDEDSRK